MAKQHDIFVSYSMVHADLVAPLVQLLRLSGRLIFHDKTSIEPGEVWSDRIMQSLDQAKTVIVIWCSHASESEWVKIECEAAVEKKKKIVPVILDGTTLPSGLSSYQWIDMKKIYKHKTSRIDNARKPRVQITYEVKTEDKKNELPFVVDVIADLGGTGNLLSAHLVCDISEFWRL